MIAQIDLCGVAEKLAAQKVSLYFNDDEWDLDADIGDNESYPYTDSAQEYYQEQYDEIFELLTDHIVEETIKIEK